MVKDDPGSTDAATSSRFLRQNSVDQFWKFKLSKFNFLKIAILFIFASTLLLFFLESNLTAGTCECLCWRTNGICGHNGPNTSPETCTFATPDQASCESRVCGLGVIHSRSRVLGCVYMW